MFSNQRAIVEGDRVKIIGFGQPGDNLCEHEDCIAQREQFIGRSGTVVLTDGVVADEDGLLRVQLDDASGLGWFEFLPVYSNEIEPIDA